MQRNIHSETNNHGIKLPFLTYIHNFRAIAILSVVLGHFLDCLIWENRFQFLLCQVFVANGTVYFLFIAGFLFQYLRPKYQYKKYLKGKIKYVVIPYILVSIPAILSCLLGQHEILNTFDRLVGSLDVWQKILFYYLTGRHLGPLWFIPMICIFYIIAPFLIWLESRIYSVPVILLLAIVVPILLPRAAGTFNNLFQSTHLLGVIVPTSFMILYAHFLPVYLLGMSVCRHQTAVFKVLSKTWVLLTGAAVALTMLHYFSLLDISGVRNMLESPLSGLNTLAKEILSVVFLYLLSCRHTSQSSRLSFFSHLIADLSFGIYFIHFYILSIYLFLVQHYLGINSRLLQSDSFSIVIGFLVVMALCVSILLLARKILRRNSRYLFGC
jgi:peptidoglycan/LPS O-acetylase OafA/YrhL